jgi:hypothetical protein
MHERRLRARELTLIAAAAAAVSSSAAFLACTGPGNSGIETIDASLEEAVPWTNAGVPILDGGSPVIPALPSYPPIATGMPDPGSLAYDCSPLDTIQTSPDYYDSFEPADEDAGDFAGGGYGAGIAWTGFDDLTRGSFHVPADYTWYKPGVLPRLSCVAPRCLGGSQYNWGLVADNSIPPPVCKGVVNKWALHYRGGLFTNWGGGVSSVFTDPSGACQHAADSGAPTICAPPNPPSGVDTAGIPIGPGPDGTGAYQQSHLFIDVSQWDGVAFWARTGPEGNPQMIMTLTDNFTSDRLARENQKYCRRLRKCYTRCLSGVPCTLQSDPTGSTPSGSGQPGEVYRCFDPDSGAFPYVNVPGAAGSDIASVVDLLYPRCGPSACTSPNTYVDLDFDGKECQPYTFPADDISGEYCYNPGDPPPPSRDDQCLDGWATPVDLSLDWKFYKIPFAQLRQGGFGKKAPYFNLHAVDTIAFTVIIGWADFYIDNVTFYRNTN